MNCQEDHEEITGYNAEPNKQYFTNGGELEGVRCEKCTRLFAKKEGSDMVAPTIKCQIYIYSERQKDKCKHSLCQTYHMEKLNNDGVRKRRKRNS